ncbi:MAG TPA: acyl-CoA synthetase [Acidimicrobiia bacterium]|jgi:acyl-CoA synthetase (AMP-forming)/AMP-acid ligase II|nr:acyl-CoA synthetase [Acidimicrobiia bacterium]HEV3450317.1 acyl-CoA synthetase [Acidimicrobiia bacterium]
MEFNLADLFEHAADHFGPREYVVAEGQRRTYAELDARANRLAHHLAAQGIGPGDHVGIYASNSVEWVETLWAVFKLRAVWVNINYRYVEGELAYLFENADLRALVYQREFAPRVRNVLGNLPMLTHSVVVDDGSGADLAGLASVEYETAMASGSPERDFGPRSPDDRYILYTGGTTGMPKGVVWRHEDVFFALGGGIDPTTNTRVDRPEALVERAEEREPATMLPIAPLMHGATQWSVMGGGFQGNKVVLVARFDPVRVWQLVGEERVNSIMITGDAMGRPLVEALDEPGADYDLSSLVNISSTAAVFSPSVKERLLARLPGVVVSEAIGASETGSNGYTLVQAGQAEARGPRVTAILDTVVVDDDLRPVAPGSGAVGRLARTGNIPLEYYKDPEKSADTFVRGPDGTRYSIPGDYATVEADGRIVLLGRGSISINSGGEKIYPEEVEAAIKSHPEVYDCTVVGVPDERWGQRVAAVIQPRDASAPTLEAIQEHCRRQLAGYKVPRELHVVASIVRSPSGKPDYRWAKDVATGAVSPV